MAKDPNAILIIDDDNDILTALKLLLGRHYAPLTSATILNRFPALLAANTTQPFCST